MMRKKLYPEGGNGLQIEVKTLPDGSQVLMHPRMFGVTQMVAAGEQSAWMLALKERAVILGGKCPNCGEVYVPLFLECCANPGCRFTPLEPVELPDIGCLTAEPVVTLFAPARMNNEAPFCHGMVFLGDDCVKADMAMMFRLETTTGVIRRGVYKHDTIVKLVFEDEREGLITDVFGVPLDELPPELQQKSPLFLSDLNMQEPAPPVYEKDAAVRTTLEELVDQIEAFLAKASNSPRNRAMLEGMDMTAGFVTPAGNFSVFLQRGEASVSTWTLDDPESPDVKFATEDVEAIRQWTRGGSLTNLFALGKLWMSNREGMRVLENLDRLWRAAVRDGMMTA